MIQEALTIRELNLAHLFWNIKTSIISLFYLSNKVSLIRNKLLLNLSSQPKSKNKITIQPFTEVREVSDIVVLSMYTN